MILIVHLNTSLSVQDDAAFHEVIQLNIDIELTSSVRVHSSLDLFNSQLTLCQS